ncbi:MAG: YhcG family protein [Candidatus Limimorpha sp.]
MLNMYWKSIMNKGFSLSANIENGFPDEFQYIVTPNGRRAAQNIIDNFHSGIHSFTIIGTYGTGKSSFLMALEADLNHYKKEKRLLNPKNLSQTADFEILNIVGDYMELSTLLGRKLGVDGRSQSILDELKVYCNQLKAKNKFLLIAIDEFGKILEHAAKNNPEQELYFLQKFAEFVNVPSRDILLLTTLHQNFGAYAKNLTETQKNEWTKVKGRFKEITFVEPIEQLLFLASQQQHDNLLQKENENTKQLYQLAIETKFVSNTFSTNTALQLYPLDPFSAFAVTSAIQRYGQNERSLFSFLAARGPNSLSEFKTSTNLTYNLANVYDYVVFNFYSYLKDANVDSMSWSSIQVSIERVEGLNWGNTKQMIDAIKIVKAIGLLNLFGIASFAMKPEQLAEYAYLAMNVQDAVDIIDKLKQFKIIRYAEYKQRLLLFDGTDIDLELEIQKAGAVVARPVSFIDDLRKFINSRISPVKAHYYHKGTPRYFEYEIREDAVDMTPTGDTDGYIELIFSTEKNSLDTIKTTSANTEHAVIYAYFNNIDEIIEHLYNIKKYEYILTKVLIDKDTDRVAYNEMQKLKEYEETLLNKAVNDNLFAYRDRVIWLFKGEYQEVSSLKDFNQLLSKVCDDVYPETPVMINELFNRHKLSGAISAARKNYLTALVEHYNEEDLGIDNDKFPPEKTIYYSLLKNTGLHNKNGFSDVPTNNDILSLWNESVLFLKSTKNKQRKISELIKILSEQPFKMKQGFIDFWIPTFLFIKRQDFALYDANRGTYIPNVDMLFFDLLQKHPADYAIKAFEVDGVRLDFFNQYRRFVNLDDEFNITTENFIETIKPFLFFYKRLNDYTKHTRKFTHKSTMRFRDVLATAKDPEKAFFEDLPEALGFTKKLKENTDIEEYGNVIQKAIRELRSCYTQLIDRLEIRLIDGLGLESADYNEYVEEIRQRLANVKMHLLTTKQKEFYHHATTEYDNRTLWYQSICYPILDHKLESLRDDEEDKLADDLVYLFRECEKYADISKKTLSDSDVAYSFDMVTNTGSNIRTQTYILSEKDKNKAIELEGKINDILLGDNNVDICTLLEILNKKNEAMNTELDKINSGHLIDNARGIIETARANAVRSVDFCRVQMYWNLGRRIFEEEQQGKQRADYGAYIVKTLADRLETEYGSRFGVRQLKRVRQFYRIYPNASTLRTHLNWSQYKILIHIDDPDKREYYELVSVNNAWTSRETERQINSQLHERLILNNDKDTVLAVARKEWIPETPQEIIKDPMVLEFLGLERKPSYYEKDLESSIITHIADFLLEMEKGVSFIARQKRILLEDNEFFINLVFYNRLLRCFVIVELKTGKLTHQDLGQLQMYVNYYDRTEKLPDENPTIGHLALYKQKRHRRKNGSS